MNYGILKWSTLSSFHLGVTININGFKFDCMIKGILNTDTSIIYDNHYSYS